ncbi:hypothetical protein ACLB2K_077417 [Fragaria x ananassa]
MHDLLGFSLPSGPHQEPDYNGSKQHSETINRDPEEIVHVRGSAMHHRCPVGNFTKIYFQFIAFKFSHRPASSVSLCPAASYLSDLACSSTPPVLSGIRSSSECMHRISRRPTSSTFIMIILDTNRHPINRANPPEKLPGRI